MNGTNNTIISHFNSEVLMIHDSGLPPLHTSKFHKSTHYTLALHFQKIKRKKKNLHICTHAV